MQCYLIWMTATHLTEADHNTMIVIISSLQSYTYEDRTQNIQKSIHIEIYMYMYSTKGMTRHWQTLTDTDR